MSSYYDEINAEPEIVILGQTAERGRKVPASKVKKIVTDGTFVPEQIPTQTDVLRDLIATGANSIDELARRWKTLLRKKAVTLPFDTRVRRIAERLLRVSK